MTVTEVAKELALESLTGDINMDREVTSGYTSDLLSDVIANIDEDAAWITIQRHVNTLGVAKLKDISVIIIPNGLELETSVIEKAKEEGIAILRGSQSSFEISGRLYSALGQR